MNKIENAGNLDGLQLICRECHLCSLSATRQNVVFGQGSEKAGIFILGEAPGAKEDQSGQPFIGRAGDVLNQLLARSGLKRRDLFITGSLKCRPPRNRNPRRDELTACRPYLNKQLELIRPRIVVCLGLVALHNLLGSRARLADVRGMWFDRPAYRILPTYHPAAVLRGTVSADLIVEDFKAASFKTGSFPNTGTLS